MRPFLLVAFLLSTNILFGQSNEKIATIRTIVQAINTGKSYKIKSLSNDYFANRGNVTDNGQELKGYYKDKQLIKIIYSVGLSYCMKTYEYYFTNEELIFVFDKEEDYPVLKDNSGLDYSKLITTFEGRYYFDKGKLINTVIKGKERYADSDKAACLKVLADVKKDLKNAK